MAAKSDFAQKLLHDLRLRKERIGASTPRDAYRNQGNVQTGGSKTMNQQLISSKGSNRTPNINESYQQIVSYSGGQHGRSESIGDLSMSFTYSLKNGEKLMNMDFSRSGNTNTMINFLRQIGRRSLDVGNTRNQTNTTSIVKHRASNSGGVVTPALTTIQIKEISKGVQNLYEIIRSNSNGTNVNRYSMEVGKELLKGAKGLEESLKMLVNLQEASELMVTPKRRSRVRLQEVDDDDGDDCYDRSKSVDQNQVDLPRFSFDKHSRRSNLVLTANKFPTHQRSVSCGGESVKSASNVKNKNNSGCSEKGRISNVIAKLMGLEEAFEFKNANDSNTNTINKISRPAKDSQVSLNDQKSQQIHDSNINSINKSSKPEKNGLVLLNDRKSQQILDLKQSNNRLNQISEKKERQLHNGESKEKINSKSRTLEVAENLPMHKKKTIRTEKNNEIKLIPRNNKIREPEKKVQKSKQDSQQIKQIKDTYSSLKEPKTHTFEQNPKAIVSILKTQEPERTQQKVMPMTRKKVVVSKTEPPRTKDEVLKPKNRMLNNLMTPSKHKLSILKETKRKDVSMHLKSDEINSSKKDLKKTESTIRLDNIVSLQSGSELVRGPENARPPLMFNDDELLPMISQVPKCEKEMKSDPEIAAEIIFVGSRERKIESSNNSKNKPKKKALSIQVVLTENEKQLKEILIKDQLFLSTTEALFKLNIPVGFLHVDEHIHHNNQSKLQLDCGHEILKRKARSQELSVHPYVKPSIGGTTIRLLDELVKQLYKDLESLTLYGRDASNEYDEADNLDHMLDRDIYNKHPDINSFWDYGWNITTFTFVEKDEFVNDVERDVLHILVDEIVDDLLSMSLPF